MAAFPGISMPPLYRTIDAAWEQRNELSPATAPAEVRAAIAHVIADLDAGRVRVAEKIAGVWTAHQWVKKAVLLSFRLDENLRVRATTDDALHGGRFPQYYDKVPTKFEAYTLSLIHI